jgi:hypothetical protein
MSDEWSDMAVELHPPHKKVSEGGDNKQADVVLCFCATMFRHCRSQVSSPAEDRLQSRNAHSLAAKWHRWQEREGVADVDSGCSVV